MCRECTRGMLTASTRWSNLTNGGQGQDRSGARSLPTRGFSVLVTPFQPPSFNNLAGSLPDLHYCAQPCTTDPRKIHARGIRKINRLLPPSRHTKNADNHDTLTVRRLPICRNLLFDAPAATRQPTPSHIWHLFNIHRAAIALAGRPYPPRTSAVPIDHPWLFRLILGLGTNAASLAIKTSRPDPMAEGRPHATRILRPYQADRCRSHPLPRLRIVCNVSTLRPACGPTAIRYVIEWPKQLLHRIALFIVQR